MITEDFHCLNMLQRAILTSPSSLMALLFFAVVAQLADFYVECAVTTRRSSSGSGDQWARIEALTAFSAAFAAGSIWTHRLKFNGGWEEVDDAGSSIAVTAADPEDHQMSPGVIFAAVLFCFGKNIYTGRFNKKRINFNILSHQVMSAARGTFIKYKCNTPFEATYDSERATGATDTRQQQRLQKRATLTGDTGGQSTLILLMLLLPPPSVGCSSFVHVHAHVHEQCVFGQ